MRLNPILLLDDLLCTAANGGGVRIGWMAGAAWPGVELLRAHGVRVWAADMARNPDRRWCMVRRAQARWAVGLLKGAGAVVIEGPDAAPVAPRSNWGVIAPGQGLAGFAHDIFRLGWKARWRKDRQERRREARSTRRQRARR